MANRLWTFLSNPFETATRGNFSLAATVLQVVADRLAASTEVAVKAISAAFGPANTLYQNKYKSWAAMGGSEEGDTQTLETLLAGLTQDIDDWDFAVQQTFRKGTSQYKSIFPNGHAPFTKGRQQERINALGSLSIALSVDKALDATKTLVDARITQIVAANTTQKGAQGDTSLASAELEALRIAGCTAAYQALGGLMNYYGDTQPDKIAAFIPLDLIRDIQQTSFTGSVAANDIHFIVARSLDATNPVRLRNTGTADLKFYFAASRTATSGIGTSGQVVAASGDTTVNASVLGASATARFLIVHNEAAGAGSWTVDL